MPEDDHVLEFNNEYTALVVDDSAFMVKNLKRMLESFGANVIQTAENGVQAVEAVEEHGSDLDIVTLDITMPEKDGIEALEEMLEIEPDLNVVMVSSMGQEDTVKKSVMKGAKHFVVKPFERDDVYEKLSSVLDD